MPAYIIASDISKKGSITTGAIVWQSMVSDSGGVKTKLFPLSPKTSTNHSEIEMVIEALSKVPKYSEVKYYTDQMELSNHTKATIQLRVKAFFHGIPRSLVEKQTSCSRHKFHYLLEKICKTIDERSLEVQFIRWKDSPFYVNAHKVAKAYRESFQAVGNKIIKVKRK